MTYETRAFDKPTTEGFGPDPVVVLVVTGQHDVSRLIYTLSRGVIEQIQLSDKIVKQMRRHNGGRAALALLKQHGGPDFTSTEADVDLPALIAEVERLRELVDEYGLDEDEVVQDPDEAQLGRSIIDVPLPETVGSDV